MSHPAAIFVFGQAGCSHCSEYIPRFKRLSAPFRGHVPIGVYDLAYDRHAQQFAERLGGIQATPTTVVMTPRGALQRHVGVLADALVVRLLKQIANGTG